MTPQKTRPEYDVELTDRQKREREYYDTYCSIHDKAPVNFAPIEGNEKRPWNSYWHSYAVAVDHFKDPSQRLLDFGCGTGQASICMAKVGYQVSGFDISETQIESCRHRAAEYGFTDRTDFRTQVAEHLLYDDNTFDCIIGIDILHHLDIEPSIREAHRVLKDGGIAVFREWIEAPVFDRLRESTLVRYFFPKGASFEAHRTHDERKLNRHDMTIIRSVFPQGEYKRFCLTSRIHRVCSFKMSGGSPFERFDEQLIRIAPFMASFGGEIVMVLRK